MPSPESEELSFDSSIIENGLAEEYPFASHYLDVAGGKIHYVDEGEGAPLLFVHGNPTWSFAWRNLIKRFRSQYRCIAIDHLGCGLSEKPADGQYGYVHHIERLQSLVNHLELDHITLIAHDWGGAIGCGVAGRDPDRFSRIVLMNTGAFRSQAIPLRIAACRIPLLGTMGVRGLNLFAGLAIKMAVEKSAPLPRLIRRGYLLPYDHWGNRIAIDRFVKDIPLRASHPSYDTLVETETNLARLAAKPILLPWGMKDWCFTPRFLETFQQFFPQAKTIPFPAAGHYLFEDEPEGLGEAIEQFLQDS